MQVPLIRYFHLLINYLKPQKRRVFLLSFLLFSNITLLLVSPRLLKHFIDAATSEAVLKTLIFIGIIYCLATFLQKINEIGVKYLSDLVGWTATNALREDLAEHCLHLDMPFHHQHTPGEMIERIDGDINDMGSFFSTLVQQVVGNALLLLGILALLFIENWQTGVVFSGFSLFTLFFCNHLRSRAVPYQIASRQASAETYGYLEEQISATEDIKTSGAVDSVIHKFLGYVRTWYQKTIRAVLMTHVMLNVAWWLFYIANAAALLVGGYFYLRGEITLGSIYLIFHYVTMLRTPIEQFVREMDNMIKVNASITRTHALWNTQRSVIDGKEQTLPTEGALEVSFEHVSFHYHKDERVLHAIHFTLGAGRSLGLIGRTGCGKTTLTRLLFRFYDPDEGTIRLGGQHLRKCALADLRNRVSLVPQQVHLFEGTIRDNLTFYQTEESTDTLIYDAFEKLKIRSWLDSMPRGLDTRISSDGSGFSAGEAQLIALARVFMKNAGLVLLDEASSRLDRNTEGLIQSALAELVKGRTAIIIAHNLSILNSVDEIMVMDKGHIIEHSDRKTALADNTSRYSQWLTPQNEEVLA